MKNDTIFGKIIRGEVPATKVYEDERCLAFLDIHPVAKGHLLLIPKEHYQWMQDAPDELISYLFIRTKMLMQTMIKNLKCDYVQVSVVGKDVPHFHIHLIPRMNDSSVHTLRPEIQYADQREMDLIAQKMQSSLSRDK